MDYYMKEEKDIKAIIKIALAEDIGSGDITTEVLVCKHKKVTAAINARENGVVSGLDIVEMVFDQVDPAIKVRKLCKDGDKVKDGTTVCTITGDAHAILRGERVALNYLCYMSGISTETARYVKETKGTKAKIFDTRKTMPGFRYLEKYAVLKGGGENQRIGLYDQVLMKDNHFEALSDEARNNIAQVIRDIRSKIPKGMKVEVEVDTLKQLKDVLPGHPDIILLDNMNVKKMKQAIELIDAEHVASGFKIEAEASGGITIDNLAEIAKCGVDRISIGAITHSSPILDFSLEFHW